MNRLSVFQAQNYKGFVIDWIAQTPNEGRGQRKLLAGAIGCQTPFVTHVLSGDYHFSLEQGEACARWMGLNEAETEFFLLLISRDRAGTLSLKNLFSRQIESRRDRELSLKKKVRISQTLDLEAQVTYYSHWLYAAVHMALLIPNLRSLEALQKYFQLPAAQLLNVLKFLSEHRMIEETKSGFRVLQPMLFLPRGSRLLPMHHSHWRLKAIEKCQANDSRNLHYSVVMSLSEEAYDWLRVKMVQAIEEAAEKIKPSSDEKLACMAMDLFEI